MIRAACVPPFFLRKMQPMHLWLYAVFSVIAMTRFAMAGEIQPYTIVQSINYSQPVSVAALFGDWHPPFNGGDTALTYNKAEAGVTWDDWQLGLFKRNDYRLEFSRDMADFYFRTKNRLPLDTGRTYYLRIRAQQQVSHGLRLGYRHQFESGIFLGVAGAWLQGDALTDGHLDGQASAISATDYDFQFDTNYVYSRDVLFERDVNAPQGDGYSVDINLRWTLNEYFAAQLEVTDLAGEIRWKHAPYTTATATSATKSYDENGYVRYAPAISGYESWKNFTQTLPRKIFLVAQYRWTTVTELVAEYRDLKIQQFTAVGMGWRLLEGHRLQGLYNLSANALSLRYAWEALRVEVASDDWRLNRAHYFAFQFAYHHTL